jgi:hypothetical protein
MHLASTTVEPRRRQVVLVGAFRSLAQHARLFQDRRRPRPFDHFIVQESVGRHDRPLRGHGAK